MDREDKVRVKHSLNLLCQINKMKDADELTDVVLVAQESRFPCHRLLLAAFSPYFQAMFTCGLAECSQREVVLHDAQSESVATILNYMYNSNLCLTNSNVQGVAMMAYFFQMEAIFMACQKYMMDHMDASNCLGIYYFAKQLTAEDLADQAGKYLHRHFAEVCLQEEVLEIEGHQLLPLVCSDDLNISREESILDLVLRWVNYDRSSRADCLVELMSKVRLELISPSFLKESLKRNVVLLSNVECYRMIQDAIDTIHKAQQHPSLSLRYGMENTDLLLCIGNNGQGIRSRHKSYTETNYCYAPTTKKSYYIVSPRCGEALGYVCTGVVTENNDIILTGEAGVSKLARQKTNDVEIVRYHVRGNQHWEKLCSAPFRELYAAGTAHGNLYLIGGQMKLKGKYLITNCVDKYTLETGQWRSVAPLPLSLACHAAVTVGNHIYVLGGWTPQTDLPDDEPDRLSNRMFRYDPGRDKWTERGPMEFSKYRFSTAVLNNEIYVLGGIGCCGVDRGQARRCLDAVEIYNPDGDFWRNGPPLPMPILSLRTNSTNAGAVDGRLYVCGAFRGADRHEVIVKDILELDPWENVWNVVARNVLMHDSYDVCLVARLNSRDLIPPPPHMVDQ
ncbi:kelch repeat and BTB domain-containing protein 12 [Scyliorhinus canicula]|uniref:kelch repeat and BTB domain-containing protein 12 n=1 Tax=Scyliorhinus canicula TaxID=7830 RepID=UPI0018F752A7|nr:kelch repeat and BTB domain-containing protein 12 [Scyliorhinus canicula]XP_038668657.1 kelch repeat and BTB domain-containing protein 12 [Scyliorhinus canicula]